MTPRMLFICKAALWFWLGAGTVFTYLSFVEGMWPISLIFTGMTILDVLLLIAYHKVSPKDPHALP